MSGVTRPDEWGHSPWRVGGENRESEARAKEDWLRSTGIAGLRKKDSFALDVDDKFVTLRDYRKSKS